ncbi:unnamed protein product [Calicophoron daubneyi]|uniref:Delta-like protein n=1 Tax=Calicophoron daubneyi TaxID=300641 RepID=A0AAV2T2X4_CALDB
MISGPTVNMKLRSSGKHPAVLAFFLQLILSSQSVCGADFGMNQKQDFISRSAMDLRIETLQLPTERKERQHQRHISKNLSSEDSETNSFPPFVVKCCPEGSWIPLNGCSDKCQILIGFCLSRLKQNNSIYRPITLKHSKLFSQSQSLARRLLPTGGLISESDSVSPQERCDFFHEQIRSGVIANSHLFANATQTYRIKINTVPVNGLLLVVSLYHRTQTGALWLIDRLQRPLTSLRPDNTWSTIQLVSPTSNGSEPGNHLLSTNSDSQTYQNYSFLLSYRYACRANYYGEACNRFCSPSDNALGHYQCNPQTGAFICNPGWTGTRCDEALCQRGCIHGICESPNHCQCMEGWTGPKCDECMRTPGCEHGRCKYNAELADWIPFTCQCELGWNGMLCNINAEFCASHPSICQNGGQCVDTPDPTGSRLIYRCLCPPGYEGMHCEIKIIDCRYHGCQANGECQSDGSCKCFDGYYGYECQFNHTDCKSQPCLGLQSTCTTISRLHRPVTSSGGIEYSCHCESGREGQNCEYETNECANVECLNGGKCVHLIGGYQCICPPKFAGTHCQLATSACTNMSCANGGECIDGSTYFTCHCTFGWTGPTCRENVNECAEYPRRLDQALCKNGAGCRDTLGSYQCLCPPHWTGKHCEISVSATNDGSEDSGRNSSNFIGEISHLDVIPDSNRTGALTTPSSSSMGHFMLLFSILAVAIPVTLTALIAGLVLLISNYRSYRKENTDYGIHNLPQSRRDSSNGNDNNKSHAVPCSYRKPSEGTSARIHADLYPRDYGNGDVCFSHSKYTKAMLCQMAVPDPQREGEKSVLCMSSALNKQRRTSTPLFRSDKKNDEQGTDGYKISQKIPDFCSDIKINADLLSLSVTKNGKADSSKTLTSEFNSSQSRQRIKPSCSRNLIPSPDHVISRPPCPVYVHITPRPSTPPPPYDELPPSIVVLSPDSTHGIQQHSGTMTS